MASVLREPMTRIPMRPSAPRARKRQTGQSDVSAMLTSDGRPATRRDPGCSLLISPTGAFTCYGTAIGRILHDD